MGKRANGEGSVYRRGKDGRWVATLRVDGRLLSFYGPGQKEAMAERKKAQERMARGFKAVGSGTPLGDYLKGWLEGLFLEVRPATSAAYRDSCETHIIPRLGGVPLKRLEQEPERTQRAWKGMLDEGHSAHVVRYAHAVLHKALNDALKKGAISRNPLDAVTPPSLPFKELRPPDAAAMERILEAARGGPYYEPLLLAYHTGLRRNEMLGLLWRDVDVLGSVLSVSKALYRARGQSSMQEPKTAKGRRTVALTPTSTLMLRRLRERQEADGLLMGYAVGDETQVFRCRDGRPILPDALTHAFKKLCVKAGVGKGFRLHDVRHAHATVMLKQGVHPKVVQERLGHSRISVTLDVYSSITPGMQESAALRFEEGLPASRPGPRVDSGIEAANRSGLTAELTATGGEAAG